MALTTNRLQEIDRLIDEAELHYSPHAEALESTEPGEADNNLGHEWQSILASLPGVTEEELREYCRWRNEAAEMDAFRQRAEEMLKDEEDDRAGE